MKSVLIIGMGRMGRHLAGKMMQLGNDVMIVDHNRTIVEGMSERFTDSSICDCTNEAVIVSLGVSNFDICFVTIGENFQSSLEISSQLKELGAKRVISKANRDIQAKFLLRNGADEVVYPERDMAEKLAVRCSANNLYDFIELTADYSIFEIPALPDWVGKTIGAINIRRKYDMNVLTIKKNGSEIIMPTADYQFDRDDHVIVLGKKNDVLRLISK